MNTLGGGHAFASVTEQDTADDTSDARRVVVVPSLWAPFHHMAAVEAVAAFVATVRPDGVVFMNVPGQMSGQALEALTDVVAGFRAGYAGPIGVHGHGAQERAEHGACDAAVLASVRVTVLVD